MVVAVPGQGRTWSNVQSCLNCQAVKNAPAVAPLHPWLWPAKPYQRLHLDFAARKMYLIVVDSHSKWPEVIEMTTTTSEKTIAELWKLFSAYGLPEQVVMDSDPQFTSEEFSVFMQLNGLLPMGRPSVLYKRSRKL